MDFNECIEKRYSVRKFMDKKIDNETLKALLKTISKCPTAKNIQPVRVYAINSDDGLKKIREITKSAYNAPCVLIFTYNKKEAWVNPYSNKCEGDLDASITATYLMLQATNLGLGSCFVAWFKPEMVREAFGINEDEEIVSLLPVGYIDSESSPSERHFERKKLSEIVTIK